MKPRDNHCLVVLVYVVMATLIGSWLTSVAWGQPIASLDVGGWRSSGLACAPGDPNCKSGCSSSAGNEQGSAWVRPIRSDQVAPDKYAAVVRVSAEDSPGIFSSTSGTIIDRDDTGAYVLTASHLLDDWAKRNPPGQIIIQVQQQKYAATLLGRDPAIDAAVLKIRDPGVEPIPTGDVSEGESWAGGYPEMKLLRWAPGRFINYREQAQRQNSRVFTKCAVFSGSVTSGDSGGPIVQGSPNGRLVAVIWGGDERKVYGTPVGIIRRALGHLVPCWRRELTQQSQSVTVQMQPPPVLPGPGPIGWIEIRFDAETGQWRLPDGSIAPGPHPKPGLGAPGPADPPDDLPVPIQPPGVGLEQIDAINARLDALAAAIAAIPAGRTGDTGQQGARGLQGERGADGVCDPLNFTDAQVEALAARLPALVFQARTPDGELYGDPVPKRLGETVFLKTPKGE